MDNIWLIALIPSWLLAIECAAAIGIIVDQIVKEKINAHV